ncbi:CdaR family protein [Lacticaseibacillus pabuli]|uniref:CdaR family protein n=1 Tax=Lacticaseibacillus pabuli TaxID=3025672 RepID=A0ABY7WNY9_9LACO|nr:CdaR family protein [Lacticaseibacillus sp. KACC 23028]WDF81884.1 CdaR family protein [Lacticaseibacillus sp. KACC 23028]
MSKIWDSPWVYRILALILTLGLFVYVNQEKLNKTFPANRNDDTSVLASKKETVRVPLQLNADTDKYFITGYPEKVKVTIEGSAALVTAVTNTQNFRVVADLRKLSVGTHTVKLTQQGLSKQLTYKIQPATIKVSISDRINKTMPVQVHYNKDAIADGYQAGTPQLSADTVQVTGSRNEIDRIFELSASVTLNRNTKQTVNQTVVVQALDSNGNTLNVVVAPETVRVKLPVTLPSKRVDIKLKQAGTGVSDMTYSLKTSTKSVRIYGAAAALKKVDSIEVPVDVSGVKKAKSVNINLVHADSDLTDADPSTIKVDIGVEPKANANLSSTPDMAN